MANNLKVTIEVDVRGANESVDDFEKRILNAERKIKTLGSSGGEAGRELASGFGIPIGPIAGVTAAIGAMTGAMYGAISVSQKAIAAAREGAQVNHILQSSATEAGLAYADAAEQAALFAKQTGQEDTVAALQFAGLARVAGSVGQQGNLAKIQQSLADLSAAHGTKPDDILDSVITGREAGLRAAGIFDVTQRYEAYAKALGITKEQLSDTEQREIRLNAVTEKGAQFAGSAAEFLATTAGQIQVTEARLGDMTEEIGKAIFAQQEFRDVLTTVNDLLHSVSLSADEVAISLKKGVSADKIAQDSADAQRGVRDAAGIATLGLSTGIASINSIYQHGASGLFADQVAYDKALDQVNATAQQLAIQGAEAKRQADANQAVRDKATADRAAATAANLRIQEATIGISHEPDLNKQIAGIQRLRTEVIAMGESGALVAADAKQKLLSVDEQLFQTHKAIQALVVTTFDDTKTFLNEMNARVNQSNPFVKLTEDASTVMERMRKRFGAFGEDFVQQMAKVESKAIEMEALAARIQSAQKVLDIQAEIRRLQFGPTGTTAEDQRRLGVYDKQITAARDIPGLEATSRAIATGKPFDSDMVLKKQITDILALKAEFSGATGYGDREAQGKINTELINLFQGASPQMQARMLQQGGQGIRAQLSGAYQEQADQKRQDIEDERRRAQAGRFQVEDVQKSLDRLGQFGGLDNDEVRKQFLSKTGTLSQEQMTPEIIRGRIGALDTEAKKEAKKEKEAEQREKLLTEVLTMVKAQLGAKGLKTTSDTAGVLVEVKDSSNKASVTGPAFSDAASEAAGRRTMQGL